MIPGDHYNWRKGKYYTISEVEGKRNFWKQMLTGDAVDNILGLYGVGPKSAHVKAIDGMDDANQMFEHVHSKYRERFGNYCDQFFMENGELLWILKNNKQKRYAVSKGQPLKTLGEITIEDLLNDRKE